MSTDLQTEIDRLHRAAGGEVVRRSDFTAAQARAEPVYSNFGKEVPQNVQGESLQDYRLRLLDPFKQHSSKYQNSDLSQVNDPAVFGAVEDSIYQDAQRSRTDSQTYRPGELKAVRRADAAGRIHTSFYGDPLAAWAAFTPPPRYARFLVPTR